MNTDNKPSYNNILARLPIACYLLNRSGSIIFANDALLKMLAYNPEQLIGENIGKIISTWNKKKWDPKQIEDTLGAEHCSISLTLKTRFGDTLSALLNTSPQAGSEDEVFSVGTLTLEPVAEVEQHGASLSQYAARFRACFASDCRGMALVDQEGRWIETNTALSKLLGYDESELLYTRFQAITHVNDLVIEQQRFTRLLDGSNNNYELEKRFYHKTGESISTLSSVRAIPRVDEDIPEFLYEVIDLSQRKNTEAQLERAQKLAALGHLTSGISHDFNNALAIIQNNLDLLDTNDISNPVAAKRIRIALNAVQGAAGVTQRLLAISSEQKAESKMVNIHEFLTNIHEIIDHALGESICLTTNSCIDLWLTNVDSSQLESVLINLAVNARDAMPNGGKLDIAANNIPIESYSTDAETDSLSGDFVQVSIADNGIGIPLKLRNKVLQPFFTTKPPGKGTGLGLSMVYAFVKQHGGHVKITSEENYGTTVNLYLPRFKQTPSVVQRYVSDKSSKNKLQAENSDVAGAHN